MYIHAYTSTYHASTYESHIHLAPTGSKSFMLSGRAKAAETGFPTLWANLEILRRSEGDLVKLLGIDPLVI